MPMFKCFNEKANGHMSPERKAKKTYKGADIRNLKILGNYLCLIVAPVSISLPLFVRIIRRGFHF